MDRTPPATRVLIVDDHRSFAELVADLVARQVDLEVVGIASSAREARALAVDRPPRIVHDPATGLRLAGAAEGMRARHQGKPPLSASLLAATLARVASRLSEDVQEQALARGRGLSARAAIELALERGNATLGQSAPKVRSSIPVRVDVGIAAA